VALLVVAAPATPVQADDPGGPTIIPSAQNDTSAPLTALARGPGNSGEHRTKPHKPIPGHDHTGSTAPSTSASSTAAPALLSSFDGVGNGFSGPSGTFSVNAAPPDTNGAVGPNHYVQIVNSDFAVFNKSGTVLFGPVPNNTVWSGFGGGCQTNNDGDPTVVYDGIADRWVISQFSVSTLPYLMCVAVSTTSDPTGSYYRYSFNYGNTSFPDYPKLGVWPDGYYLTVNLFANGSTFSGAGVAALDRTRMLAGQPATQQMFQTSALYGGLLPATLDGSTFPPAGSPNYLVALGTTSSLVTWKFHVDWTTPASSTFSPASSLTVASYGEACGGGTCIPQAGTTQRLDSLADRLMYRLAYRNFGDHQSLVVDHSVTVGSSVGVRWYELRVVGGNPTVYQQGTYAPDSGYRWMGSVAMDQSGNIGLGFSISSSTLHPGIHYTGRLAGDAAGTMTQGEGTIVDGAGSQTGNRGLTRWGDYSAMTVDPTDGCTFWYTNEYIPANGEFNWKTRIGTFKLPGCGNPSDFTIGASPSSVSAIQGTSVTSNIATAATGGPAESVTLSASGVPANTTASFSPNPITAGFSSTLTLAAGSSTPTGTYAVIVTGTAPSATHNTTVTLTVTAPPANDFSIGASPSSVSASQGGSASSAISTAVVSGSAETVALSASGMPSGTTASLDPNNVTAGGGSTLTLVVGSATAPGTYSVSVTGTAASASHSTTVALTVVGPPSDFTISANPASVSAGQGGSASSTITTTVTSGSAESVSLGASGVPNGTSAAFNPSTVTAGGTSTLTFSAGAPTVPGTYTVTVTGTAPSATHTTSLTLTIVASDFSMSASPSSVSAAQGGSATSTIATAVTSGAPQSVSLSASGLPVGTTATFSPSTITSGGSSTLTLGVGAATAAGSYSVTVTGTASNATHTTTVTLTVTVSSGISNGGFESGFTGWARSGSTAISSTAHGGTASAMVGSGAAFNGDSSVAQTFTAPAAGGTLSFFYRVVCTDSVTWDWATATLKDNTTGTTSTVVARTCNNNGVWVSASATLTASHSYTLTLIDHDDAYPSDPTYTLYDDVGISATLPPPPAGVTNGSFESGLTAWTSAGSTATSTVAHSGAASARVGSTGAFNGDSSVNQTFTAPAGVTTLTFWYRVVCTDSVTWDWATATLRDNTAGTTNTVLPRTCTNTGAWTSKTIAVVPGHSYTLTLIDHDDAYPPDPTYTLYDDVTLQ